MISESFYWKLDLLKQASSLRKRCGQKRWPEAAMARCEQTIMLGFYSIRKLIESVKLTDPGDWAICDGPGPTEVAGYIVELPNGGGWVIKDDPLHKRFLDHQSAAATVLGKPLPEDLRYYSLKRGDESGVVLTYPDVLERLLADGWTLTASARTLGELD